MLGNVRSAITIAAVTGAALATALTPAAVASTPWQVVGTPNPGHNFGYQQREIFAVTSGGSSDTYALLSYLTGTSAPTGSRQLILHRVTGGWSTTAAPTAPKGNGYLEWAANVGGADVWMFGYQGQCGPAQCLWAIHHTSQGWRTVTLGTPPASLQPSAVRAFGDHDIWEVGHDAMSEAPMAAHWNGTSWTTFTPPAPSTASSAGLIDISAVPGSSALLAIGYTVDASGEYHPWISRYAGGAWHTMPSASQPRGVPAQLCVASASNAWLVGIQWGAATHITYKPLLEHWNGTAWRTVASPPITGDGRLVSVAMSGPHKLLAVGFRESSTGVDRTLAETSTGGSWSTIASPNPSTSGSDVFYDLAHVPGTADFWAVGTDGRKITPATDRNTLAAIYR